MLKGSSSFESVAQSSTATALNSKNQDIRDSQLEAEKEKAKDILENSQNIFYSKRYADDKFEYRYVGV